MPRGIAVHRTLGVRLVRFVMFCNIAFMSLMVVQNASGGAAAPVRSR